MLFLQKETPLQKGMRTRHRTSNSKHTQKALWTTLKLRRGTSDQLTSDELTPEKENASPTTNLANQSKEGIQNYPFSTVGVVTYEVGKYTHEACGFLVARNVVLTSARHLFDRESRQPTSNIRFEVGSLSRKEREIFRAVGVFYSESFVSCWGGRDRKKKSEKEVSLHDYGLIKLADNVDLSGTYGYLGVDFEAAESSALMRVIGFGRNSHDQADVISCEPKMQLDQGGLLKYNIQEGFILPGAPIIQTRDGQHYAVGIHSSLPQSQSQSGLLFTPEALTLVNEWVKTEEEEVDLRDKNLGKHGVKELVRLKNTPHVINLARNGLGKDGLKHFARVEWPNLYHLDLGGNDIGNQGVAFLVHAHIPGLKVLNIWGNQIGSQGAEILASGNWPKLQILNVYNNQVGKEGAQLLLIREWPLLSSLNMGKNGLDCSILVCLKKCPWRRLVCLNLWGNSIKQAKTFSQQVHAHFPRLKFLYL